MRQLVLLVWTSALGIVSTLSLLDSANQRLLHDRDELVTTLARALSHGAFSEVVA